MPLINKIFNGRLNRDDHPYRISEGDYIDALNITRDSEGEGSDKVNSNIVGNEYVPYNLPAGFNKVIGGREDKIRNRYYYFIYNDQNKHSILYFSGDTVSVIKLIENITDTGGVDILGFNPSEKIFNINVIHRDEGDLLFFIDSLGRPSYINVNITYTPWVRSYLDVIKGPPSMLPQIGYENDTTVQVNNLRNALFQFRTRFVYDDFQKSVYSSASIKPLPYNPFNLQVDADKTKNSRISIYVSTGDTSVKKVEIWGTQATTGSSAPNNTTGKYFLIVSLDKAELSIPDNDIYRHVFYNDGSYTYGDLKEQTQLFDYAPIQANSQELPNGNTLIYGGITEGYNKVPLTMVATTNTNWIPPVSTFNGLLFFASQNGSESDPASSIITIYLTGAGINDGFGNCITLNNSKAHYIVDCALLNGTTKKFQYQSVTQVTNVVDILNGLRTAALAQGFSFVSQTTNALKVSLANIVLYYAQPVKDAADNFVIDNKDDIHFAFPHQSAQQFALQYFDEHGITDGATLSAPGFINTLSDSTNLSTSQLVLTISSRPPIWGKYYHVLRPPALTYNKHEFWVSLKTFNNKDVGTGIKYAYIDISNMMTYNENIQGSIPVVGYSFQAGDRIRFLRNYPFSQTPYDLPLYDYEILSIRTSLVVNGVTQTGQFLQIYYPTADITPDFDFGPDRFQNYFILLYNYVKHASAIGTEQYFEFGKEFAIGNWGTVNAFHIGSDQTQKADLSQPAIINLTDGDLFYRYRNIPAGNIYTFTTPQSLQPDEYERFLINVGSTITTPNYVIEGPGPISQPIGPGPGVAPVYGTAGPNVHNTGGSPLGFRLTGGFKVSPLSTCTGNNAIFGAIVKVVSSVGAVTIYTLLQDQTGLAASIVYDYSYDTSIVLNAGDKAWILTHALNCQFNIIANSIKISILNDILVPIIESSFSDKYAIITNSNNRASVFDENAKQVYYPTLVRFSLAYQEDTSINNTNRFYSENQDSYDRNFGDIMRLHIRDRALNVYQKLKIGRVPILTQIVQDTSGNPLQANSDQLINKIQYYLGDYGIGDVPESLAWNNFADYGVDNYRGVVWRLSLDGLKPLSIEFSMNAFFVAQTKAYRKSLNNGIAPLGQPYAGDPTIYGAFDAYTNKYIICLEEINRYQTPTILEFHQDAQTISFDEREKAFESRYSYLPEWIGALNTLLISFKTGNLWRHNSSVFNSFYGVAYESFIQGVFATNLLEKKTFLAMSQEANKAWDCPEIITQTDSYANTKQQSNLIVSDFESLESMFHASFLRDSLSPGGVIDGDSLKGNYMIVKIRQQIASDFVFLNMVSVLYEDSQLTAK